MTDYHTAKPDLEITFSSSFIDEIVIEIAHELTNYIEFDVALAFEEINQN